jgi:hypothetical protein
MKLPAPILAARKVTDGSISAGGQTSPVPRHGDKRFSRRAGDNEGAGRKMIAGLKSRDSRLQRRNGPSGRSRVLTPAVIKAGDMSPHSKLNDQGRRTPK